MPGEDFERQVFVNCPYDDHYRELQRAMIFVLLRLGFEPCLAAQISDSGQLRMEKIKIQISTCRYSIHDLSLVIAKDGGECARMNMPYELGVDLGARWYGSSPLDRKQMLVLERTRGSVKKALSDHAGFDLRSHEGSVDNLIREIRAHFYAVLSAQPGGVVADYPTHDDLWDEWIQFIPWLQSRPDGKLRSHHEIKTMEAAEFKDKVRQWLKAQKDAKRK